MFLLMLINIYLQGSPEYSCNSIYLYISWWCVFQMRMCMFLYSFTLFFQPIIKYSSVIIFLWLICFMKWSIFTKLLTMNTYSLHVSLKCRVSFRNLIFGFFLRFPVIYHWHCMHCCKFCVQKTMNGILFITYKVYSWVVWACFINVFSPALQLKLFQIQFLHFRSLEISWWHHSYTCYDLLKCAGIVVIKV